MIVAAVRILKSKNVKLHESFSEIQYHLLLLDSRCLGIYGKYKQKCIECAMIYPKQSTLCYI